MKRKDNRPIILRKVRRVVLWGALSYAAALLMFSTVLRFRQEMVRDRVRLFNKRVFNPAMMKLAGRRHWYAAMIRHKGRRSGREYATPVVAEPVAGDAFIIPLPYGEGVDWLKNVLAAGRAEIEAKGETCDVFEPEVIDAQEAYPLLDERHRRTWHRFGIQRFLRVKRSYRNPAAPRWQELREFRATHPSKHTTVNGVDWEYIVGGEGEEAFLILPGGAMVGEAGFTRIPAFEDRYRVIAPSYASVSTAVELLDGLAGVLDAEGVRAAHVLGPSYGGIVAQGFVRRHPGRVKTLILANTLVPPRSLLWLSKASLALLPLLPVGWLRTLRERSLARAFSGVPSVPPGDQAFWRDYQHGLVQDLSKTQLRDMFRLGIDLAESFEFGADDLASWPGRVFILESDEDPVTPRRRAELRRCYPRAGVYTIHGAGHTPWMSHKQEYLSVIKEFLAGRVPEASRTGLEERLRAFRRAHPYREMEVDGVRWRYVLGGGGERTLLLPSGGTRVPDVYFLLLEVLESRLRVISPCYPAVPTMDALVEGLAAVLDAEGVDKADLFGSSFGGFVAQCFVRRHPERVRSLTLANTGAPGASPLPALSLLVRLFELLPWDVVRRATGWNWRRWFVAPPEEQTFWYGLLDELLETRLTKADLVSALAEMQDYDTHHRFTPLDLADWPGRVLLIESAHDEAFSPAARAALRALYPRARVLTFGGSGHAVMVTDPAEYIAAVKEFLDQE